MTPANQRKHKAMTQTAKGLVVKLTPDEAWILASKLELGGEPRLALMRLAEWLPYLVIRRLQYKVGA